MTPLHEIVAKLEREGQNIPDEIVVSPAYWAKLSAAVKPDFNAFTDEIRLEGMKVTVRPYAEGVAFFKNGKLLRVSK
jgi:hypothetical protein